MGHIKSGTNDKIPGELPESEKAMNGMLVTEWPDEQVTKLDAWIPTSERLPEDNQTVIVTWINENPEPYIDLTPHTSIAMRCGDWYWWYPDLEDDLDEDSDRADNYWVVPFIKITAWMPLPEPYRELTWN